MAFNCSRKTIIMTNSFSVDKPLDFHDTNFPVRLDHKV